MCLLLSFSVCGYLAQTQQKETFSLIHMLGVQNPNSFHLPLVAHIDGSKKDLAFKHLLVAALVEGANALKAANELQLDAKAIDVQRGVLQHYVG